MNFVGKNHLHGYHLPTKLYLITCRVQKRDTDYKNKDSMKTTGPQVLLLIMQLPLGREKKMLGW